MVHISCQELTVRKSLSLGTYGNFDSSEAEDSLAICAFQFCELWYN